MGIGNIGPTNQTIADVAKESTLDDIGDEVEEIDGHHHNVARAWGAVAVPDETNAIEANVNRPFVAVSGNNTWGAAIPICGTADTPIHGTATSFDPHEVLVVDTDHATTYRMRLIYGTGTSADAISAGQWSEFMFITNAGPFPSGVEVSVRMPILIIGTKLWAQVWNATNASEIDFFWKAHGYPPMAGV